MCNMNACFETFPIYTNFFKCKNYTVQFATREKNG